jgi:aminopeptidase N
MTGLDPAFRALALRLPGEDDMAADAACGGDCAGSGAHLPARRRMGDALAGRLLGQLPALIERLAEPGPFTPDARAAGRRALRIAALVLLTRVDDGKARGSRPSARPTT